MALIAAACGTAVFGLCEEESEQLVDSDTIAVYRIPKEVNRNGVLYRKELLTHSDGAIVDGTPYFFRSDEFDLILKEAAAVVAPLGRLTPSRVLVALAVPCVLAAAFVAPLVVVVALAQVIDPYDNPLGLLYLILLPFAICLCLPLLYFMRRYLMAPRRAASSFIVGTNEELVPQGIMVSFDKRTDYCSATGIVYTTLVVYVDTAIWSELVPSIGAERSRKSTSVVVDGGDDAVNQLLPDGPKAKETRDYRFLQDIDPWS